MRRLPNTYPGNTTLYPNGRGTIGIGAPDAGSKVLFYNETPVNLDLDFYNGNTDVLHAWEANFWTLDGEVGDITWAIDTDSLAVVNPPINAVFTTLLNPEEKLNDKAYPMPLIRQIGGQQAIVSSASQTINDGNALQQVVEATLQGHASSDVIINNDGSYTLKGAGLLAAVGVLTHILGTLTVDGVLTAPSANVLGAAAVLTHILGTLTVEQAATLSSTLAVVGASSLDNGTIATNGTGTIAAAAVKSNTFRDNTTGGDQLDLSSTAVTVNGNLILSLATGLLQLAGKKINDNAAHNLIDWTGGGLFLKGNPASSGPMNYQGDGAHTDWTIGALGPAVTGSASATVNHLVTQFGASHAPTDFYMNPSTGGGSQTFGFNTITSTQVNVVLGATNAYRMRGFSS